MTDDTRMDFGQALHLLLTKQCDFIARNEWNVGTVFYIREDEATLDDGDEETEPTYYMGHLLFQTEKYAIPWVPSMRELLADDWFAIRGILSGMPCGCVHADGTTPELDKEWEEMLTEMKKEEEL
jgi:hypothetical protein